VGLNNLTKTQRQDSQYIWLTNNRKSGDI